MAHRALVVYRDGDRSHLHYAHWGERLADAITPSTPFGGRDNGEHAPPAALLDRFDLDPGGGYASETRVDPRPLARAVEPAAVLAAVDASIESLVVVDPDFETRTYLVCSLGIDGGEPLVLAGPTDDEAGIRRTLRTVKECLGARVEAGELDAERARLAIRRTLAVRVSVRSLDDASFLRTD